VSKRRCEWAADGDALMLAYHDEEWGVPSHDDSRLFEMLTLEGAQAGLSWTTILRKRDGYRQAFVQFDADRVARFDRRKVERLLNDKRIVRNRLKVESTVNNAKRIVEAREEFGSFDAYVWQFVDGAPIVGGWRALGELPSETAESKAMSRDLKKRGFRFVGPTVCYAFMQAVGMVNDHVRTCFRYRELSPPGGRSSGAPRAARGPGRKRSGRRTGAGPSPRSRTTRGGRAPRAGAED
jgi:DNA-3-methyladenine glycosylase I